MTTRYIVNYNISYYNYFTYHNNLIINCRDIIVVDNEDDIKNFMLTREKIKAYNINHWVGISGITC